jgi:beta-mannosidase
MRRTSPDGGSIHTYPDMDPTWYGHLYRQVPFISETGMHSLPDAAALREVVDESELVRPLGGMLDKAFRPAHPQLLHHFVEYEPARVPRMLSRASHVADVRAPSLETLAEATQIGAGEFYQILSEQVQANYPATAGLIPWVFKRPWPVIAIMLVDGFGQPTAPYYFLKRTYEPTHVLVKLPQLLWAKGEELPIALRITHAGPKPAAGLQASVEVFDAAFASKWKKTQPVSLAPGPSVAAAAFGTFTIPDSFEDTFFFVVAELRGGDGRLVSRAVYWPRCLARMNDAAFRQRYRQTPRPTITLDKGPWLKPQTTGQVTSLRLKLVEQKPTGACQNRLVVHVANTGGKPAFNTRLDVTGVKRCFWATDNFFWLAPGEERQLQLEVRWREPDERSRARLSLGAWNATSAETAIFNGVPVLDQETKKRP